MGDDEVDQRLNILGQSFFGFEIAVIQRKRPLVQIEHGDFRALGTKLGDCACEQFFVERFAAGAA